MSNANAHTVMVTATSGVNSLVDGTDSQADTDQKGM